jgi:uncharacterized protein YdhG (YjbR/CyaY superfamily)
VEGNKITYAMVDEYIPVKKHIGSYPAPTGIHAFQQKLSKYKGARGFF